MAKNLKSFLPFKSSSTDESIKDLNPLGISKWIPLSSTIISQPSSTSVPPIGRSANEFAQKVDSLREMQAARKEAAFQENERKKEILHQRNLAHNRDVNHKRLVESSNELRELISAANHIAAQKTNLELMQAKVRRNLNERLSELQFGAECRSEDSFHAAEKLDAERLHRQTQNDLKEAYERHIHEKEERLHQAHLALEEERKHIEKITREESQKRLEVAQGRLLEKQRWQQVIQDFKDEREARNKKAAEDLRKENEKIASFNVAQNTRRDNQKELREQRDAVAEKLRNRLAVETRSKENKMQEREEIAEELFLAETEEKEVERRRQLTIKKMNDREELRKAFGESKEIHRLREEKEKRHWKEFEEMLKTQSLAADQTATAEDKIRHERRKDLVDCLNEQRDENRERTVREKQREDEWSAKEEEDRRFWRTFVEIEREKYLRKRIPQLKSLFRRFPHKKDDDLLSEILKKSADGPLINQVHQPLAKVTPQLGSHYEVYHNLQDARLAQTFGIGSR